MSANIPLHCPKRIVRGLAPASAVPACCHINTGGILQSAGHRYNIILICFWLLRSNFESSQYSRYLALGNSRVTAAAGLRLYTHPVQITLLTTYIVLIDLLKLEFHWKSIELLEYLHRRIVTRSCLYNFQMEVGVILILFLTLAARTRCIYHIAATISPPQTVLFVSSLRSSPFIYFTLFQM